MVSWMDKFEKYAVFLDQMPSKVNSLFTLLPVILLSYIASPEYQSTPIYLSSLIFTIPLFGINSFIGVQGIKSKNAWRVIDYLIIPLAAAVFMVLVTREIISLP